MPKDFLMADVTSIAMSEDDEFPGRVEGPGPASEIREVPAPEFTAREVPAPEFPARDVPAPEDPGALGSIAATLCLASVCLR